MKQSFNAKKILALLLAVLLVLPVIQTGNANAEVPSNGANSTHTSADYFKSVYEKLANVEHVYRTLTYHELDYLLDSDGTYVVLFGGAWNSDTQAAIGYINEVAKEYGITTIHNFDTRLDGKTIATDIAESINSPYSRRYVDLVNKYLKNINDHVAGTNKVNYTYTISQKTLEGTAAKIQTPFLFVYDKNHKNGIDSTPIISSLESINALLTNGVVDSSNEAAIKAYKDQVRQVFNAISVPGTNGSPVAKYDVFENSVYIPGSYNKFAATTIFDESDGEIVIDPVTLDELEHVLDSEGTYVFLIGCSWCANTRAIAKYVNKVAKEYNIEKVYNWDTKLDGGIGGTPGIPNGTDNANFYQIRATGHPNANLYVDWVNKYLTNIQTEYQKSGAGANNVKYTVDGQDFVANKLQAPYVFVYNKDNKDANGNSAPILGHVELMYSWTNIQPDYGTGENKGKNYNTYIAGLNKLFSRVELKPSGLTGVSPTSFNGNDGQITGTTAALEYKLEGANTGYTPVTGTSITGLAAGTYEVRYAAKEGINGPISNPVKYLYDASQPVSVVIPEFFAEQNPPTGLAATAPTTADNNNGTITGTSTELEYKLSGDEAYKAVTSTPETSTSITGLAPGTYLVRVAAKLGYHASPAVEVVIPAYGEIAQEAPTGLEGVAPTTIANIDGQITKETTEITNVADVADVTEVTEVTDVAATILEYKHSEGTKYEIVEGFPITGLVPGTYLVRAKAREGYSVSPAVEVVVPAFVNQEQAAPTGLAGVAPTSYANNDGRITGTTTALEYKLSGASAYTAVTDTLITGLSSGTYQVRAAAKPGYDASPAVDVVVPAYVAPSSPSTSTPTSPSTSTPSTETPATTPSDENISGDAKAPVVKVPATTDESTGATIAAVSPETIASLLERAKANEAGGKPAVVEFKVEATTQTKTVQLTIPRSSFNELVSGTNNIKVNAVFGTVTFDAKAVKSISSALGTGDISIIIARSSLTEESKEILGDRPVYDFSVFAGENSISTFGGSQVQVSIPYSLKLGEEQNSIIVYYVTDSGNLETVRGKYNPATGTVNFATTHFSQYIIGYNKVTFADVSAASWYNDAVSFLAARSITSGTDDNNYSPNAAVTRGQFIVLLLNAYGIAPDESGAANFADAGDTYYTDYLAAAKRLGITTGIGDNKFAPDKQITREDLFTLLYRSLDVLGELPAEKTNATVASFTDAGQIAGYAQEAFKALVEGGIITGSSSKLEPKDISTRAQVAQVLYNLLSK
ncbi:S-layer homology domain-containing protein [Paenibacillus eucommiae]|uniref:Thiol-disulfide isomerase/thioredoxin n=1 Tax=Paenibacillus eucommiae TaxID=1355755 RepID=A0ABS4J731_9BACL|nr:S-layer homology domain-containing protein [Paenibacillus eucommiae]MBP1995080.1 thiol-disulfide isomerase/thioredoxin [Paenibacillus eucommiae]